MKSTASALILSSLLVAAAVVALGGVVLARREHAERVGADRKSLLSLGEEMQRELRGLDEQYESDLNDLLDRMDINDAVQMHELLRTLQGLRVCSVLRQKNPDSVTQVRAEPQDSHGPAVTLKPQSSRNGAVLAEAHLTNAQTPHDSGWSWIAPQPPYRFFGRRIDRGVGVVLTLDEDEVRESTLSYMRTWIAPRLAGAKARHEVLFLNSPHGSLASIATPPEDRSADFAIPLTSRWGTWQILAWDKWVTHISYDTLTLAIAGSLAAALVLAGLWLARMQRRAQLLAEQRVSFVNRVSHELGTPLTNMLLNLDLARELIDEAPESAKQRLALVEEETRRLARLTANVLSFSRSERDALRTAPQACVPDEVLRQTLEHFTPALHRRGLAVETEWGAGTTMLLDPDALAQILGNLISNVEKYASSGGWMKISSAVQEGCLIVRVADHGPGIPRAERERIFRPFHRLNDRVNEGSSGTGLGLSIARELARLLGGSLHWVASDAGATFELRATAIFPETGKSLAPSPALPYSPSGATA